MPSSRVKSRVDAHSPEQNFQRLFFALWPHDDVREELKQCQQSHPFKKSLLVNDGSRPVFPGNLHMTLAFLGNVDADQKACVEQVANGLRCSPFKLTINYADHWQKPRILVVGSDDMPKALVTLATQLRDGAIDCGVQMDMRPYNAHVTLMRKIARLPEGLAIRPFSWAAKSFVLIESTTRPEGVRYEVIREWELEG
ncbi:MAG: RNA 2',3'-cyclic phosphodiesterase [Gammaproteobacteria bacterium]